MIGTGFGYLGMSAMGQSTGIVFAVSVTVKRMVKPSVSRFKLPS